MAGIFGITGALIATTYGIAPHAVTVDLPAPYPEGEMGVLTPNANRLILTEQGFILWNGTRISDAELGAILDHPAREKEGATLLFTPDEKVPYARALEVLDIIRRHDAIDRCFRFSGIQQYRRYDHPESFDELTPHVREECSPFPSAPPGPATPR